MNWMFELPQTNPTAHAIAIVCLVCVAGLSLGSIKIKGFKLGAAGVLFAAILVGHFSSPVDTPTLEFVKEFGLILFVFCIGLQLGPGFFASLRQTGLSWNALASGIVLAGTLLTVLLGWLLGLDPAALPGVLAGATSNTPALGAAQQTLSTFPDVTAERANLPALACAVTYPLGVLGAIGTLMAVRHMFRIDLSQEVAAHEAAHRPTGTPLERRTLVVSNPNLDDVALDEIPGHIESGVVVSRICRTADNRIEIAARGSKVHVGDRLLAIGTVRGLGQFQRVVGSASSDDLLTSQGSITQRRVVVTNTSLLGKSVDELNLDVLYGVTATRVGRGDLEMTAVPSVKLQFGDVLQVVGPTAALDQAAAQLGNSVRALNATQFVPFFAGISLGIGLGTMPIPCPGVPYPLRLGLAGGPLIVAILVGRLGRIGRLVWHMPYNANLAFREFGIALFFASVGLLAGPTFFSAAWSWQGLLWLLAGLGVTIVPLAAGAIVGRQVLGMDYVDLCGLLAGSMTNPPALTFAGSLCQSESPAVAYATVYPVTMLLRILSAQALTVFLCR